MVGISVIERSVGEVLPRVPAYNCQLGQTVGAPVRRTGRGESCTLQSSRQHLERSRAGAIARNGLPVFLLAPLLDACGGGGGGDPGPENQPPRTSGDHAFAVVMGASYRLTRADISATDEDSQQLTWRVTAAPVNGRLALASAPETAVHSFTQVQLAGGAVVYVHNGGGQNSDTFRVQVEDDASPALKASVVTVRITVIPDTMVTLVATVTSLAENFDTSAAVKVADVAVTGSGSGSSNLELAGADAALFELNVGQTEVLLKAGTVLDFEGGNRQLDVIVRRVADANDFATLRINITDVDEAPGPTTLGGRGMILPTAAAGAEIGLLSAADPDRGDGAPSFLITEVKGQDGSTPIPQHPFVIVNSVLKIVDSGTDSQLAVLRANTHFTLTIRAIDANDASLYRDTDVVISVPVLRQGDAAVNVLTGDSRSDYLEGLGGSDVLNGDGGNDFLDGGGGDDQLTGGEGSDLFIYRFDSTGGGPPTDWKGVDGRDQVLDFSSSEGDRLQLLDGALGADRIDTLSAFKAAFDLEPTSGNPGLATRSEEGGSGLDLISVRFGAPVAGDPNHNVSGQHLVRIRMADTVDSSLYDATTGYFHDVNAFIAALGGEDALLFG